MNEIELANASKTAAARDNSVLLSQFLVMSISWDPDYCKIAISQHQHAELQADLSINHGRAVM